MDKKQFRESYKKLHIAFGENKVPTNHETLDLWYEMFKGYDGDLFDEAIQKYILTNPYPPTIANINAICIEIKKSESFNVSKWYITTFSRYPNAFNDLEAKKRYMDMISEIQNDKDKENVAKEFDVFIYKVVRKLESNELCEMKTIGELLDYFLSKKGET